MYELSKFIVIPPVLGVTRKCAVRMHVTEGGHDEIRTVYLEEFVDVALAHDFFGRSWDVFLEKSHDYTDY